MDNGCHRSYDQYHVNLQEPVTACHVCRQVLWSVCESAGSQRESLWAARNDWLSRPRAAYLCLSESQCVNYFLSGARVTLVPSIWYHLSATVYLVPSILYLLSGTIHLVSSIRCSLSGAVYLVPYISYRLPDNAYLVPPIWYQLSGTVYLVPSIGCSLSDTIYLVPSIVPVCRSRYGSALPWICQ